MYANVDISKDFLLNLCRRIFVFNYFTCLSLRFNARRRFDLVSMQIIDETEMVISFFSDITLFYFVKMQIVFSQVYFLNSGNNCIM